ncbi:MAG: VOC family protein, partial [Alphaproteobacteria bacterium]
EGMAMLVFESRDAHADHADFMAGGLTTYPVFDFSRKAKLPNGEQASVAFSLAFVTHEAMPQAAFFTCQQHAPEYFWKPDYQRHINGAQEIGEIVMVADEPGQWRGFFEGMQGAGSARLEAGRLSLATARGTLSVMTPDAFAGRFPGEAAPADRQGPVFAAAIVRVSDQKTLLRTLAGNQIEARESADGSPFVPASQAFGLVLGFAGP